MFFQKLTQESHHCKNHKHWILSESVFFCSIVSYSTNHIQMSELNLNLLTTISEGNLLFREVDSTDVDFNNYTRISLSKDQENFPAFLILSSNTIFLLSRYFLDTPRSEYSLRKNFDFLQSSPTEIYPLPTRRFTDPQSSTYPRTSFFPLFWLLI